MYLSTLLLLSITGLLISYYITEYTHLTHTDRVLSRIYSPPLKKEDSIYSRKIIGTDTLQVIDPFLRFTHYKLKSGQGLLDHAHRGYDTITYVLKGELQYEDFHNNSGVLKPGDCQWVSSGKGIVHAEVASSDSEVLQLWLGLPMDYKLADLYVQTMPSEDIVTATERSVISKVLAGETMGKVAPTLTRNPAYVIDTILTGSDEWLTDVPAGWNAVLYVLDGEVTVKGDSLKQHQAAMLSQWDTDLHLRCLSKCRVFLFAAQPLDEMMVLFGQFYMPNYPMAEKAHRDLRDGKDGFEAAPGWKSRFAS
jgi:redox-sensitive bicupin YhaK (pirin superfamily)